MRKEEDEEVERDLNECKWKTIREREKARKEEEKVKGEEGVREKKEEAEDECRKRERDDTV